VSIAVKGHASLGARWSARALASADSLRSASHVWMFAVVCVTEQLVAIASAVGRHSAPVVDRTGSRPPKSVS
jgi:hypothetical protein